MSTPLPPPNGRLTRQQQADAHREVKELLAQVRNDWTYIPPPPPPRAPAPLPTRAASTASARSGVLGSWRPAATSEHGPSAPEPYDSWDDEWNTSTDDSSSDSDSDLDDAPKKTGLQRAASYRRPTTPPVTRRRRRKRRVEARRTGEWRQREDDSDFEIPAPASSSQPYRWDSPATVPSERRRRRRHEREMMEGNPGLRTWLRRRDQWTQADAEGWVRVGESRFCGNPLRALVNKQAYPEIYRNCVVNSRALPVPIGLASMVEALVDGWKEDDLWPPKQAVPEPMMARRRAPGEEGKGMGGRVRRYLGLR